MRNIGVLFDLDGVLIDSERLYSEFYDNIAELYDIKEEKFSLAIKGTTIEQILSRYFPEPEASADVLRRINEFEANMRYPICDGVIGFLEALRAAGIPCAVVTSSSDNKMQRLYAQLPHFADYFDAIITGTDVTRSKPDPQGYMLAAERIGRRPADCYVFEDSLSGIEAGVASGAVVIGLTTTLPEERLKGKAHKLIDGFAGFGIDDMLSVTRD